MPPLELHLNCLPREALIEEFLGTNGFTLDDAQLLDQDASFRRYLRLRNNAMLMDAGPPEDVRPFLRMAAHLFSIGLSVPRILAADEVNGLVIEEDLGDHLFSSTLTDANARLLLDAAVDALVVMQRAAPPRGLPPWGKVEMQQTALGTLFDWWWPATHDSPAPDAVRAEVGTALSLALDAVDSGPRCLVHRDFFAGNLLWLPTRLGARRVGIIDFQGAAIGHPAYDLVSLLQDARRDMDFGWEERAIDRYLRARPDLDPNAFRAAYAVCAAQRHLRVACQWVRLAKRDGRLQYLVHGPRTWGLLTRALTAPVVAPLAASLDRCLPLEHRRNPPSLAA